MKISLSLLELKKGIGIIVRGVSSKPHLPILSGILLRVKENKVSLESTDLEVSFWVSLSASVEEEGEVVIPAKLFSEFVNSLSGERVDIEVVGGKMKVSARDVTSEIVCQTADDFPVIPRSTGSMLKIDSAVFKEKINKVNVSTAKEDTRPILTGVLWELVESGLNLVATDGFRLSTEVLPVKDIKSLVGKRYIIPAKSLLEVSKAVTEFALDEFGIEFDDKTRQVIFVLKNIEISSRLLEGEYPPYQQIIPNTYNTKMSLSREELLSAVKRASLFARDNANIIKIRVEENKMLVSAENSQIGSNVTSVENKMEGDMLSMAFNAKYLIDYLSVAEGDYIDWETEGELKPSVFRDTKNANWLQVIMPIRIQN